MQVFLFVSGLSKWRVVYFSDASDPSVASFEKSSICMLEDRRANSAQMLRFFPKTATECVLLLDENNLHFSSYLSREGDKFTIFTPIAPPKATTSSRLFDNVRILWSSHNSGQSMATYLEHDIILWDKVKSVFWFPTFDSCGNNEEEEKNLVKVFFQDMALKMLRDSIFTIRLIITMNNIRFSQIQVEKWARNCFFFL